MSAPKYRKFTIPVEDIREGIPHPELGLIVYVKSLQKVFILSASTEARVPTTTELSRAFEVMYENGATRARVARFLDSVVKRPSHLFRDQESSSEEEDEDDDAEGRVAASESGVDVASSEVAAVEQEWLSNKPSDALHSRLAAALLGNLNFYHLLPH